MINPHAQMLPSFLAIYLGLFSFFFYRRVTAKRQCPACGDAYPDRIPRSLLFKLATLFLPFKLYHCDVCNHSFIRV